jgi:hypothetical protein
LVVVQQYHLGILEGKIGLLLYLYRLYQGIWVLLCLLLDCRDALLDCSDWLGA